MAGRITHPSTGSAGSAPARLGASIAFVVLSGLLGVALHDLVASLGAAWRGERW